MPPVPIRWMISYGPRRWPAARFIVRGFYTIWFHRRLSAMLRPKQTMLPVGKQHCGGTANHFFSPGIQFTTTVSGGDSVEAAPDVTTRKRFPSAVTSYWNETKEADPAGTMCASNSGTGTAGSNEGFGPGAVLTATAVIFPSAVV